MGVLTFGIEQFSVLFVPGGRSARAWRTVRAHSVLRMFFVFLLGFAFDPFWFRVLVGSGFGQSAAAGGRSGVPGGQSACSPRTVRYSGPSVEVLVAFSDGLRRRAGQFAVWVRTVHGSRPEGLHGSSGQSAPPGQTVRPAWPDSPPEADSLVL
jgi:hypothetical protein